jgi:RNA polymerase sigma factor (sigma-70 family)
MESKHLDIVERFKTGINEGLTLLYEEFGRQLFQYSRRYLGLDEDECYDVLYKTLETVGKVIDRYDFSSEKYFTNWLFKIHKNNTLMLLRSKRAKEQVIFTLADWQQEYNEASEDDLEPLVFDHLPEIAAESTNEDGLIASPLYMAMEKALQQIDETERDILLLRMNNYSYEEIAEMLSIPNNQLKVKFLRAKAKVEKKTMDIIKNIKP